MRCVKYATALVYKMVTIICCTHCDCMLPVRWCEKVEKHCSMQIYS